MNGALQVRIKVNDRDMNFNGATLEQLIYSLSLDPGRIVVERNGNIVIRGRYDATCLAEGDVLEIVRFVGGG